MRTPCAENPLAHRSSGPQSLGFGSRITCASFCREHASVCGLRNFGLLTISAGDLRNNIENSAICKNSEFAAEINDTAREDGVRLFCKRGGHSCSVLDKAKRNEIGRISRPRAAHTWPLDCSVNACWYVGGGCSSRCLDTQPG